MNDQHKPTADERFVMKDHAIFDIQANAFIGAGDACYLLNETRTALGAEREKLDHEIMCHAACGVIAMSNTRESLAKNRVMKPEYLSASVQDCIRMAEREIELQQQLATERETSLRYEELAVVSDHKIKTLVDVLKRIAYADPAWRKEIDDALEKVKSEKKARAALDSV